MRLGRELLASPLLLTLACGPLPSEGDPGVVRQGNFIYCDTESVCSDGNFPAAIAVGATFLVSFEPGTDAEEATVETSQPALLEKLGVARGATRFQALKAGAALLQARTTTHRLVDALDVALADVAEVDLRAAGIHTAPDGGVMSLTIRAGGPPTTICATALDAGHEPLGGAITWSWSSSDGTAVELDAQTSAACRALIPKGEGTVTVTASTGGVSTAATVTVAP